MNRSTVTRRLAAILIADVVGYTRLMERDDTGTFARLRTIRDEVVDPAVVSHGGRIVKTAGDGLMAEFASALSALRAAVQVQREMATRNAGVPADGRIEYRIGINLGDVMVDGSDLAGDGINVAARLETICEPGGICVSGSIREQVHGTLDVRFDDIGEQQVKNIARPIRVYRIMLDGNDKLPTAATATSVPQRAARRRWLIAGVVAIAAIGVGVVLVVQLMKPTVALAPPNSVAILPFTAPAGSLVEQQFADALTQDLTATLGRWRMVRVASPGLAAAYKGKALDARAAGRELNVRYLVEGEIRPEPDRDVVGIRLVDTGTGAQLWSDQNEVRKAAAREEREVLIMRSVRRLRSALYDAQRNDPNQSAAMKLYFQANTIDATSREGILKARSLYDEALRLQPDFELALIGRGWNAVDELKFDPGPDRDRLVDEALGFSARAVAIDADDRDAWKLRGVALGWQGRLDAAFEADARARQLDPSRDFNLRAWLLVMNGQANEALAVVERALTIDPLAIGNYQLQRCWANLQLGRYDEAIAACEKSVAVDEQMFLSRVLLTAAYAQSGNATKAAAEEAIVQKRMPGYSIARYKALWKSDSPAYQAQTEAHIIPGLRKAGIPEK